MFKMSKNRSGQWFINYGIDWFCLHNIQIFEDLKTLPISNKILDKVWSDLATEKSKIILISQHHH